MLNVYLLEIQDRLIDIISVLILTKVVNITTVPIFEGSAYL